MALILTCNPIWIKKLMKEQPKVVVVNWSEKGGVKNNEWTEKLQELEHDGIRVFVHDDDSCKETLQEFGEHIPGETVIYANGKEIGRVTPGEDFDKDMGRVKELVR